MAFPTIPTVAAGRLLTSTQTTATTTHTFPNLSSLTKGSGDLLVAIIVTYDGNTTNAEFSGWGGSFTEFVDQTTTTTIGIGAAYKFSPSGSETGTFTVTSSGSTQSAMFLMSIPGAHAVTIPEGGTIANGTTSAADPASFDPTGWAAEDTLWIAVGGAGEDATTGSFTGIGAGPASYSSLVTTTNVDSLNCVVGGVAFRQLNASSENVGTFTADISNARNSALVLAVRPSGDATATPASVGLVGPGYARCDGTAGTRLWTPDSAGLSPTADIDIKVKVALDDWTPAAENWLLSKWDTGAAGKSYNLGATETSALKFDWTTDGSSNLQVVSDASFSFADGSTHWVRATMDANDGAGNRTFKFYTSNDTTTNDADAVTWTQLGSTLSAAGTTSLFDSTAEVNMGGSYDSGAGTLRATGNFYAAQVKNGYDGTGSVIASPRFQEVLPYTDTQSNVWTAGGGAVLVPPTIKGVRFPAVSASGTAGGGGAIATPAAKQVTVTAPTPAASGGPATPAANQLTVSVSIADATGTSSGAYGSGLYGANLYGGGSATGDATPTPAAITISSTTQAATATGGAAGIPAADPVAVTVSIAAATGSSPGNAAPAPFSISVTTPAATATGTATAAPSAKQVTIAIPAATASVTITASPAAKQVTVTPQAVTATGTATTTPTAKTVTVSVPAASASGGGSDTATPGPITVLVEADTATATGGNAYETFSKQINIVTNAATASVTVTAAPAAKQVTVTLQAVTATGGGTTAPAAKLVTVTVPAASATGGGAGTAAPGSVTVSVTTPTASATVSGTATPAAKQVAVTMPATTAAGTTFATPAAKQVTATVNAATATGSGGAVFATPGSILVTVTVPSALPPPPEHPIVLPATVDSATIMLPSAVTATITLPLTVDAATITLPSATDAKTITLAATDDRTLSLDPVLV